MDDDSLVIINSTVLIEKVIDRLLADLAKNGTMEVSRDELNNRYMSSMGFPLGVVGQAKARWRKMLKELIKEQSE